MGVVAYDRDLLQGLYHRKTNWEIVSKGGRLQEMAAYESGHSVRVSIAYHTILTVSVFELVSFL